MQNKIAIVCFGVLYFPLCYGYNAIPIKQSSNQNFVQNIKIALQTKLNCIDKVYREIPLPDADADDTWRTKLSTVIPKESDILKRWKNPENRPQLVTFDAVNTLIIPSQSVGRWYREALHSVCDMRIRLPRPAHFTTAFNKAYKDMSLSSPCFGVVQGITSRDWWLQVVRNTYRYTKDLNQLDEEELESIIPKVFEVLYDDVFATKEGWRVKENVEHVLQKLSAWRDQGGGPKIGVISNFDERLPLILSDLGLLSLLDFVVTSRAVGEEKPNRAIFDHALALASCDPSRACHIGDSLESDVLGAIRAGWSPLRVKEFFDEDFPDWSDVHSAETTEEGAKKHASWMQWGRLDTESGCEWVDLWSLEDLLSVFGFPEDPSKPIATTYYRGIHED